MTEETPYGWARVENLGPSLALVIGPDGYTISRELRRVQADRVVIVMPIGSGHADFDSAIGTRMAEGRRSWIVTVDDLPRRIATASTPAQVVDWQAAIDRAPDAMVCKHEIRSAAVMTDPPAGPPALPDRGTMPTTEPEAHPLTEKKTKRSRKA